MAVSILFDKCWSVIFTTLNILFYQLLLKLVSIFAGLQVESLFKMMNIINKKLGKMLTETYSTIIFLIISSEKTFSEILSMFFTYCFFPLQKQIENFMK